MAHVFILTGSCLLLLLVLSNLLLCQGNDVCPSCHPDMFGIPLKFLKKTFSRVSRLSHDMRNLTRIMLKEFEEKYPQSKSEYVNTISDCHTSSLQAPQKREMAEEMNNEDLTKWILMLQYLWTTPLFDLGTDHRIKKDLSNTIISSVLKNIKKSYRLRRILERRFSQIYQTVMRKFSEDRLYWSGYRFLVSSDEDVRHSALYNLLKCLRRDSHTVDMYSKILACRISYEC